MPSLKDIKLRISSIKSTQKTTRAMKMVAASKLRRAQDRALKFRPYAQQLSQLLNRVLAGLPEEELNTPLTVQRPVQNVLIVLLTSNKGLAGAFNMGIIRHMLSYVEERYGDPTQPHLHYLCVGRKGYDFLRKRGYTLVGENHDAFTHLNTEYVAELTEFITAGFEAGTWDRVELVYNEFKTVMSQNRRAEQFLPLQLAPVEADTTAVEYLFEPRRDEILANVLPLVVNMQLYRAILESNSSEHGARMVAMDAATENAQDLLGQLRLSYNKARQAAITKELIEIVSGAEALAG